MNSSTRSRGNATASRHSFGSAANANGADGSNKQQQQIQQQHAGDHYHNGQTPACQVLVDATRDVFAELQPDSKQSAHPSLLGRMIRASVLEERWQQLNNNASTEDGVKKKKKRKKKKKGKGKQHQEQEQQQDFCIGTGDHTDDPVPSDPISSGANSQDHHSDIIEHIFDQTCTGLDAVSTPTVVRNGIHEKESDLLILLNDEADGRPHLVDGTKQSADGSGREHFRRIPSLESLPSDDGVIENNGMPQISIQQIKPQLSEHDDDDEYQEIRRDAALGLLSVNKHNNNASLNGSNHRLYSAAIESPIPRNVERRMDTARVKNPFNIRFLLQLPFPDPPRELAATDGASTVDGDSPTDSNALFDNWLDHLLKPSYPSDEEDEILPLPPPPSHVPEHRSLKTFVQYLATVLSSPSDDPKAPTPGAIPYQRVMDACDAIDCYTCKEAALEYLNRVHAYLYQEPPPNQVGSGVNNQYNNRGNPPPRLVLDPKSLERPQSDDAGMEVCFDYVAMEEGMRIPGLPHHGSNQEEEFENDLKNADINRCITFVPDSKFTSTNGASKKGPSSSTRVLRIENIQEHHVENLARQWLPYGIDEAAAGVLLGSSKGDPELLDPNDINDDNETTVLHAMIETNEGEARKNLHELRELCEQLKTTLNETERRLDKNVTRLEFKTFPDLKDIDKKCCLFLDKVNYLLKLFTSRTSPALHDLQLFLWVCMLQFRDAIFRSVDIYYEGLEDGLAESDGKLPQMFASIPLRNLFHSVVAIKVRKCCDMVEKFEETLSVDIMREWFTHVSWIERKPPPRDSNSIDEQFFRLMEEINGWTVIIFAGRMSDIHQERSKRTERLLSALQNAVMPLMEEYRQVEQYFAPEFNNYFQNLCSNITFAKGVCDQMKLMDQNEAECLATGTLLMWRHIRLMQARWLSEQPAMPQSLRRWMIQGPQNGNEQENEDRRIQFHHYPHHHLHPFGSGWTPHPRCPDGGEGGGKRRVMCILAGLAYQWLKEQCMEWNAQLAEEELLGLDEVAKKNGKMSKKKKKKGKKAIKSVSTAPEFLIPELHEQEQEQESSNDENDDDKADRTFDEPQPVESSETEKEDSILGDKDDGDDGDDDDNVDNGTQQAEQFVLLDDDDYIIHKDDYELRAGVLGYDNEFQSAEEFLVSRMRALLSEGNVIIL